MESIKLCEKCGKISDWNNYFQAYICNSCHHKEYINVEVKMAKEYPVKIKIAIQLLLESQEEMDSENKWSEPVEGAINALYPIMKELPNVAVRKPRK